MAAGPVDAGAPGAAPPDLGALGAALAASAHPVFATDAGRRILWSNDAFSRVTGYELHEARGQVVEGLIGHRGADEAARATLARALAGGHACRVELLCRAKDGADLCLETELFPQRDAAGVVTGFIEVATDVTARVEAAEQLADSRALLEQFQQLASIGGWEVDLQTQALKLSPQMLRIFDLPADASASFDDFVGYFDPPSQERIRAATAHCIRTGEPWNMELSLVSAAGRPRWVRTVGEVLRRGNRSVRMLGTLQDFTERRGVDEELRARHLQLSGIIDHMPCGVSVFDRDMRLVEHNARYESLYGFPKALLVRGSVHFDELARHRIAQSQGDAVDLESQVQRANAQARSQAVFTLRVRGAGGRELEVRRAPMPGGGFVLTHTDVTERSQSARALRQSLKELADLKTALDEHAIVVVTDATGRITAANEKFCAISKYTEQELIGRDKSFTRSGVHPREFFDRLWETIRAGRVWRGEICERARDGTLCWLKSTVVPFLGDDSRPYQYVVISDDITGRKQAEEALRASERLMRLVIDNIPGLVGYWDRDQRCVFANRTCVVEHLGSGAPAVVGHTMCEVLGEQRFESERDRVESALRGERQLFEREERRPDGQVRTMYVHYIPDWKGNEVQGFFALALDISELKQARDAAQQASAAKAQFLANTSHEIRTPMNAIMGMLTLLGETALTPRQTDYVAKAAGAARSLLGLLNDLLDFSKVEAGKMTLDVRPFGIDALLGELSVILAANTRSDGVEVLFDVDARIPPMLLGDDMRLRQILINLGGNAIKFTEHGEVVVAVKLREHAGSSVLLEFSVRDTGIGISPAQQARIFEGFTQAEPSTVRRYGGTGLGLAISQRLVRLMGGELELESVEGKGSQFFFCLPLPVAQSPSATPKPLERLRALFIDDNAVARRTLSAQASALGWTVETAASGEEGVAVLRNAPQPFDVVFVDWLMPGVDGLETSRRLRQMPGLRDLPLVIMLTAQDRARLSKYGPEDRAVLNGYLVKPVTATMLMDAVREARGERAASAEPALGERPQPLAGLRLLVVDDNANNRQIARELLGARGAQVETAVDGRSGVEQVRTARPPYDLVLMDVQMPGMDGYTATRAIRALPGGATLPVVAMTANAMPSDREAALASGMNDHVAKPLDVRHLVETILLHVGARAATVASAAVASSTPEPAAARDALDLAGAIDRLDGDVALYRQIYPMFRSDGEAMLAQLPGLVASGRRSDARRILHTLKGMAGTVGALALVRAAQAGEVAMDRVASDDDQAVLHAARQAFNQACLSIDEALPSLSSAGGPGLPTNP